MNNQLMLKAATYHACMEKQALMGAIGSGIKAFGSGLLKAPVMKTFGGLRKAFGFGQQAIGGMTNNAGLMARGAQNMRKGTQLRNIYGIKTQMRRGPMMQRIGRGLAVPTVGAGIYYMPNTAAEYMGAGSVDPNAAAGHSMAAAQDRVNQRMQEFGNLGFMDRMRAAYNPEEYTNNMLGNSAEYNDLASYNSNPGFMSYVAPFISGLHSASDPIRSKVNYNVIQGFNKQANYFNLVKGLAPTIMPRLQGVWQNVVRPAWQHGRDAAKWIKNVPKGNKAWASAVKSDISNQANTATAIMSPRQKMLYNATSYAAKNPMGTAANVVGGALPVGLVLHGYGAGREGVYDQAASAGRGMADAQFAQQFQDTNPFLRFGAAFAPGLATHMVNQNVAGMMHANRSYNPSTPYNQYYGNQSMPANPYSGVNNSYGAPSYQLGNQ